MFNASKISHDAHYSWKNDGLEVHLYAGQIHCTNIVTAFPPYLYLTAKHLETQTDDTLYSFLLTRPDGRTVLAIFYCVERPGNVWESPPCAPFGGIQCDASCQKQELVFFLNCIREWITLHSGKRLVIKTAPCCYEPLLHDLLHNSYLSTKLVVSHTSLNSHIAVGTNAFAAQIRPAEKRRLRKARNAGMEAKLDNDLPSASVYAFLEKCRLEKGYRMSLSLSQITLLREKFPAKYQVFTVMNGSQIIALTLTVRVNENILYNFLCGDLQEYRVYSPVVLLLECVYKFCQQQKIAILDLGISLDQNGCHKPSLIRFKRNIGGQDSVKLTYETNFPN